MSHPSDYQYQSYVDPNNSLKSERLPIVNGQSTVNQHIQNGMQSPHSNLTGMCMLMSDINFIFINKHQYLICILFNNF